MESNHIESETKISNVETQIMTHYVDCVSTIVQSERNRGELSVDTENIIPIRNIMTRKGYRSFAYTSHRTRMLTLVDCQIFALRICASV